VEPGGGAAFQDQPEMESPGSSSRLAVPRKRSGRFESAGEGGSITATGAALATHRPVRHQAPDGQGVEAEQVAGSGRSLHPATASANVTNTRGAQKRARLVPKGLPLRGGKWTIIPVSRKFTTG
jgi:hypothetical protein